MFVTDFQFIDSPQLLLLAVFVVALLESLVIIGLLIPGVGLLLSLILLATQTDISLWLLCLCGAFGAFSGDALSYELGKYQQHRIWHWRWFRRHPDWLHRGELFFRRYGIWSIALGRFVGPVRPLVPAVAGAFGMPRHRFYCVNGLSAGAWAIAYLSPMYWLGEEAFDDLHINQLIVLLAVASLMAAMISLWLKRRS